MEQTLEIDKLEKFAYADLAAGKETRNRHRTARQAIVVGARDWLNRWFWLHIWAGRLTASDFKDRIIQVQEQYAPRRFGLEANGMQVLFGSLVREEAKSRLGTHIRMSPIHVPTNVEKNYRIRTGLEPPILQGRMFIRESDIDARSELTGFPTAMTKDIIDAMEMCMNRVAPKHVAHTAKDTEKEEYARYLRNSGMPAHLIQRELLKFQHQGSTIN